MWTAEFAAVFDDVVDGLLVVFDLLVFEVPQIVGQGSKPRPIIWATTPTAEHNYMYVCEIGNI